MKEQEPIRPIEEYRAAFADVASRAGFEIDHSALESSLAYTSLLLEWNQVMNLTALTSPEDVAVRHFLDSWILLPLIEELIPNRKGLRLIDVGTGAGFPGLPLKILRPDIKLVLLDSLQKRVNFLKQAAVAAGADDVECIHGRAEEAGRRRGYRDSFEIAAARAVASMPELCEYCLPFVKPGGYFIAMKGDSTDEVNQARKAIHLLSGKLEEIKEFTLPGTDMKRSLIVIRKTGSTPQAYPRKAGKPHASPLL